jgi:DNA-binding CsgD family transcriptional regulator
MDRTKNRSDRYQYVLVESPCSPEMLAEVADAEGMAGMFNAENKERIAELREQLKQEFWRLVDEELTDRQREVIRLYAQGFTQIEIAKKLNVNQSSITKSLNGNCDYRNGKKIYGGARKKLRRLASKDKKITAILGQIAELLDDDAA